MNQPEKKTPEKVSGRRLLTLPVACCLAALSTGLPGTPWQDPSSFQSRLREFVTTAPDEPDRLALLVGIDRYDSERVKTLRGCENDVWRMHDLLVDGFGFPDASVFTLLNEEATHANIVQAFEHVLIRSSREGTEALFYFSGHGSRTRDESGLPEAERDHFDSTFVAHDSRAGDLRGEHDLIDDELRSLLAALTDITPLVTVITDSCHSGDATRLVRARAAPVAKKPLDREWVSSFWPHDIELSEDSQNGELAPDRYIHIAAAQRHELAWEYDDEVAPGETVTHGALTLFLASALERTSPDTSWRSLLDDVAVHVATVRPQSVNYRGNVDRAPFGAQLTRPRGFRTEAWKGRIKVHAGWLSGIREGSILNLFDAHEEAALGQARVIWTSPGRARAEWIDPKPDPIPEGALRSVESARGPAEPALRVFLRNENLHKQVADLDGVDFVNRLEVADYTLGVGSEGWSFQTTEGLPLDRSATAEGAGDPKPSRASLEELIRSESRWRTLHRLGLESGSLPLRVTARPASAAELERFPGFAPVELIEPQSGSSQHILHMNGVFQAPGAQRHRSASADPAPKRLAFLEITNPHAQDVFVYVLSIEESRAIEPIAPPMGAAPVLLRAGSSRTHPFSVVARRDWPLERPMRDRYVVISTLTPVDLSIFRSAGQIRSAKRKKHPPTPPLLERVLAESLTRGPSSITVDRADWGVAALDVLVESPTPH